MEEKFKKMREFLFEITDDRHPEISHCIDPIISMWRQAQEKGVHPEDFAFLLHELSFDIMGYFAELEETEEFARFVRKSAETTRKIISEHWPPPDRTQWPYNETEE